MEDSPLVDTFKGVLNGTPIAIKQGKSGQGSQGATGGGFVPDPNAPPWTT